MTVAKLKLFLLTIVIRLSTLPCLGHAQLNYAPLITSPGTGDLFSDVSVTVGCVFTVGFNPVTVTALGLFDSGPTGFEQAHSVGLWTLDGQLLESVNFQPGTNGISVNGFLFQNVTTQYVLPAGTSWVLGAYYPSGTSDSCYANDSIQTESWSSSVAHFIGARYTPNGASFTFPTLNVSGLSYVGPNLLYAVPEPNPLEMLMCSGFVFALGRVLRK